MTQSHHERLGKGLELLSTGLKPFVEGELKSRLGNAWDVPARKLSSFGRLNWDDPKLLLDLLQDQWKAVFASSLGRVERSYVIELLDWRNKWAHRDELSGTDVHRALDSMARLLRAINAPEADEIERMRRETKTLQDVEHHHSEWGEYLRDVVAGWEERSTYVRRAVLEKSILDKKHIILIGAPGAGKSTLLRECQAQAARDILAGTHTLPIPCFLNLVDGKDLVFKIASETGQTEDVIHKRLDAGDFWIAFDGVDEMVRFEESFPPLVDFIKRYRKNKFALSVRREVYQDRRFSELFEQLKKRSVDTLTVGEFGEDERHELVQSRIGDEYYTLHAAEVNGFIASLPDANPITLEMAADILRDAPTHVYENPGRFYQQFFQVRLKREADKKRLGRGTDTQLETILTVLGGYAIENNTNSFSEGSVLEIIRSETNSEPSKYYALLLSAEILDKKRTKVRIGREEVEEERVQFHHHTYRDFFVADALVSAGTLTDSEIRIKLAEKQGEENMIVLLCGIERSKNTIDAIIRTAIDLKRVQLAIDCFCNTRNVSLEAASWIADALIEEVQQRDDIRIVFQNLAVYKRRLLDPKLEKFLDAVVATKPLWRIDWEILRSELFLDIGANSSDLPRSYNLAETEQRPQRIGIYYGLSGCIDVQNESGYRLFPKLRNEELDNLLSLATDTTYSGIVRAHILAMIDFEHVDRTIETLRDKNQLFGDFAEEYSWVVFTMWRGKDSISDQDQLRFVEHFSCEKSPYVQLRMLDFSRFVLDQPLLVQFLQNVVGSYQNAVPLSYARLEYLFTIYAGGFPSYTNLDDDIAFGLSLFPDDGEKFEVHMKGIALAVLAEKSAVDSMPLFEEYAHNEHEFLRTVAEWCIKEINKAKEAK